MNIKNIALILFSLMMLSSSIIFYCYSFKTKIINITKKKKIKKPKPFEEKEEDWIIYLIHFRRFIGFLGFLAFKLLLLPHLLKYFLIAICCPPLVFFYTLNKDENKEKINTK